MIEFQDDPVIKNKKIPKTPEGPCPACGHRQYWWSGEKTEPFLCFKCHRPKNDNTDVERWWYVVP
jgi:hypothetical protein